MEIFVKRDYEKTIILREVQLTHTGHQLKMQIFHRTGILPKYQLLYLCGKIIEDDKELYTQHIKKHSTLTLDYSHHTNNEAKVSPDEEAQSLRQFNVGQPSKFQVH